MTNTDHNEDIEAKDHPLIKELWAKIDRQDIVGLTRFLEANRPTLNRLFQDTGTSSIKPETETKKQ